MKYFSFLIAFVYTLLMTSESSACDVCSIYNSISSQQPQEGSFRFGMAEQFTSFNKVQLGGKYVENVNSQHMESSLTQIFGSYDIADKFSVQATLPYLSRRFRRFEDGRTDRGTEAGVGDLTLLARYSALQLKNASTTFNLQIFGGIKLPTGDSDRLAEELEETHIDEDHHEETGTTSFQRHGDEIHVESASAIHGHDLALGSGSYDFPVGVSILSQWDRVLMLGNFQYAFRNRGDFSYKYADDLTYSVSTAYYVLLSHELTTAAGLTLSGEYKDKDEGANGEIENDTGLRTLYLGPSVFYTAGSNLSGDISFDIPLDINNSSFQAVPSYRLRAGLTFRF